MLKANTAKKICIVFALYVFRYLLSTTSALSVSWLEDPAIETAEEAKEPAEADINELCKDMFSKMATYLTGELTGKANCEADRHFTSFEQNCLKNNICCLVCQSGTHVGWDNGTSDFSKANEGSKQLCQSFKWFFSTELATQCSLVFWSLKTFVVFMLTLPNCKQPLWYVVGSYVQGGQVLKMPLS